MPSIFLKTDPATHGSDDSGLMFERRAFPIYRPGPYTTELLPHDKRALSTLDYVAPLEYYCIRSLFYHVDQLDLGRAPRSSSGSQLRLMKTLIPFFEHDMPPSLLKYVDPRLWATLIQVVANLPPTFRVYSLPLSDTYLPLLQNVNSSPDFTLITVVDMSRRLELNDTTIGELKPLVNLCVLDISGTEVTTWGIKKLSMCLTRDEASGTIFGPWKLRIWSMMNCVEIKDDVKSILLLFPLLSVVDLRGTSVIDEPSFANFTSPPTSDLHPCYYPYSTTSWIDSLWISYPEQLFACSTETPYLLHVHELEYSKASPPVPDRLCPSQHSLKVPENDKLLVLTPQQESCGKTDWKTDTSKALGAAHKGINQDVISFWGHRGDSSWNEDDEDDDGENDREEDNEGEDNEGKDCHEEEKDDLHQQLWLQFANKATDQVEARSFYTSGPRMTGTTKENNKDVKKEPNFYPPITNQRQLQRMFFRVPPSFRSVNRPTATANRDVKKKRRIGDDEQLVRKRNIKPTAALTKAFMEKMVGGIKRDDTALEHVKKLSRPVVGSKVVSQNPFRSKEAKK